MKRILIISGLFVFMWMAFAGLYMDNNPNIGGEACVIGLFELLKMSAIMMIGPVICISVKKDNIQGRLLCMWNSIIALAILTAIEIIVYGGIYDETVQNFAINFFIAVIFYYINTRLFFYKSVAPQNNVTYEYVNLSSLESSINNDDVGLEEYVIDSPDLSRQVKSKIKTHINVFVVFALVVVLLIVFFKIFSISDGKSGGNIPDNISNEKYDVVKLVADDSEKYFEYLGILNGIAENGTSGNDYNKDAAVEYINALPIDYGQSIILFKLQYPTDDTYNNDIVDYLNNRDDLSYEEMQQILEELNFTVLSDGTVEW